MRFRLTGNIGRLGLHPDGVQPLALAVNGISGHQLSVTFESPSGGERYLRCTVETEFDPSPKIRDSFDGLAQDRLPPGSVPREQWNPPVDPDDTRRWITPLYVLPEGLRSFVRLVGTELQLGGERAVGVLRWRAGLLGPHRPLVVRAHEWSLGEHWHRMPVDTRARLDEFDYVEVTQGARDELQALLDDGVEEPDAYSLTREAWALRFDNPRSALLIGVSALEIGVKRFISEQVPAAEWLVTELPAPPIPKILNEYLPLLTAAKFTMPPKELREALKNWIGKRNSMAHAGTVEVTAADAEAAVLAVRDILWRLDGARGHSWAERYERSSVDIGSSTAYRKV